MVANYGVEEKEEEEEEEEYEWDGDRIVHVTMVCHAMTRAFIHAHIHCCIDYITSSSRCTVRA